MKYLETRFSKLGKIGKYKLMPAMGLDVVLCEGTRKTKNIYASTRVIFTKKCDK